MATKTDDNQNDAEPEEIVDVDQESEEASGGDRRAEKEGCCN